MLHTQLQIIFGESSKKTKQKQKKNKKTKTKPKPKTTQKHRRPATALIMQSQLEGSTLAKISDPKEGFPDGWLSPHLCSQRPEVRPLCTFGVVVACCSEGLFLADPILVWLPKTFLMNLDQQNPTAFQDLSRQKLSKTLTFYYFYKFLSQHPWP